MAQATTAEMGLIRLKCLKKSLFYTFKHMVCGTIDREQPRHKS